MKTKEYDSSRCVGMNHSTKDMLKLFCVLNDTSSNAVINSLLRQYFLNSLMSLELLYPDKQNDWDEIRELLHQNRI